MKIRSITYFYDHTPEALAATQDVFFSGLMIAPGGEVSLPAVRVCTQVIARAAPSHQIAVHEARKVSVGQPISFSPDNPSSLERRRL